MFALTACALTLGAGVGYPFLVTGFCVVTPL